MTTNKSPAERACGRSADGWMVDVLDHDNKQVDSLIVRTYEQAKMYAAATRRAYPDFDVRLMAFFNE